MSIHINAQKGQIAPTVLMPGDPKRALYIADNYMEDYIRFNGTRGMYGYTGLSKNGKKFTVHPSGMGQPSLGIYVNELFRLYEVETIIRIGTFGSFQKDVPCGTIFIPNSVTTDSSMNKEIPKAFPSSQLYDRAVQATEYLGIKAKIGPLFSTDTFYDLKKYNENEKKDWEVLAYQGVVGVEMESHALFSLGEHFGKQTLTLLIASDNLATGEQMPPEERQTAVEDMMKIVLRII